MKAPSLLSELLFAIFLIVYGIATFWSFPASSTVLGILALAAGILKILGR